MKSKEAVPLLQDYVDSPKTGLIKKMDLEAEDDTEDDEDLKSLLAENTRRGTSLILNDLFILVIYILQIYAVLHVLSLRWPWPEAWVIQGRYVVLINLDVWEFIKLQNNGTYRSVQGLFTPSASMPVKFWYILAGWGGLVLILFMTFIVVYAVLHYKRSPFLILQVIKLQRAYIIMMQVLSIPFATAMAKVFHCTDLDTVDIDNDVKCFSTVHLVYIVPVVIFFLLVFVIYPWWLINRTKRELVSSSSDRHEGYLQLVETEYVKGLGNGWLTGKFHIFSSFRKQGAHYRAAVHCVNGVMAIFYAALSNHMMAQSILITCTLLAMFIAYIIIRPFRVKAFNVFLILSIFVLMANGLLGCFVSSFDSFAVQSPWLTPYYLTILLAVINGFWALVLLAFIIYLCIRGCPCCERINRRKGPMWPSMTEAGTMRKLTPETQKYVKAILRGRMLLEKCMTMAPMFAPAHELARQVHVINAFYREASFIHDPLEDSLWDTLDELIMTHEAIAPKSLFAESVKKSIRYTAATFMKLMPSFVSRLNQREYDFILVPPVKRRLLLKMYCMGVFLNKRKHRQEKLRLTEPAVQKLWAQKENIENDDGYYEDMYPDVEEGPNVMYRQTTVTTTVDLLGDDLEMDDDLAIEEAEQFTKQHPVTPATYLNPAYQPDEVSVLLRDDLSIDFSKMMHGVPSPPSTPTLPVRLTTPPPVAVNEMAQSSDLATRPPSAKSTVSGQPDSPRLGSDNSSGPPAYSSPSSAQSDRLGPGSRPTSAQSDRLGPGSRPASAQSDRLGPGSRPTSAQSDRLVPGSRPPSAQSGGPPSHSRPTSAQSNRSLGVRSGSAQSGLRSTGDHVRGLSPLPGQIMEDDNQGESHV